MVSLPTIPRAAQAQVQLAAIPPLQLLRPTHPPHPAYTFSLHPLFSQPQAARFCLPTDAALARRRGCRVAPPSDRLLIFAFVTDRSPHNEAMTPSSFLGSRSLLYLHFTKIY